MKNQSVRSRFINSEDYLDADDNPSERWEERRRQRRSNSDFERAWRRSEAELEIAREIEKMLAVVRTED